MLTSPTVEAHVYVRLSRLLLRQERRDRARSGSPPGGVGLGIPLITNGVGILVLCPLDRIIVQTPSLRPFRHQVSNGTQSGL
jgi:hypothetical protein